MKLLRDMLLYASCQKIGERKIGKRRLRKWRKIPDLGISNSTHQKGLLFPNVGMTNILVRGEVNYKSDLGMAKSILKKGKNFTSLKLNNLNPGLVSDKKKAAKLICSHFGDNWIQDQNLEFYQKAIEFSKQENSGSQDDSFQEEPCSRLDIHEDLRV